MIFMINNNNIILVVHHLIPNPVPMLSLLIIKFVMNYHVANLRPFSLDLPFYMIRLSEKIGERKCVLIAWGDLLP